MNTKSLRLHRLFHPISGRSILLPLDHGITIGSSPGLQKIPEIVTLASLYDFQGVVAHKGVIHWAVESGPTARNIDYLLHLSASTILSTDVSFKQTVSTIRHGLQIGVTGISMHINLGVSGESEMLRQLGQVSEEAFLWGLPLLAMFNIYEQPGDQDNSWKRVAHAVRIAGELGVDIVKVPMCEEQGRMAEIIQSFPIPILLAGGEQRDNKLELFTKIHHALLSGCSGICIGRNVFEDKNPAAMCKAMNGIVHEGLSPEQAMITYSESSLQQMSFS
jgi:DhnA family fructose-bisphosphate aldolase class Ia